MGKTVILDIIGSVVIGGILLMTLLNMKAANVEKMHKYSGNQKLQEYLIALTEQLDNDFKQIGYAKDSTYRNPIQFATDSSIRFFTTIKPNMANDPDGARDEIMYSRYGFNSNSSNPKDIIIRRSVTTADPNFNQTGAVTNFNYGVVDFKFTYRRNDGAKLTINAGSNQTARNSIHTIQLDITMQSADALTDQYNQESVRWRRVFYPFKNRNNR